MICRKPRLVGAVPVGCGGCIPCRVARRRVWTHRIILEAKEHAHNSFVTLTYDPEHLPVTKDGIPTLRPDDLTLWLKRFRAHLDYRNRGTIRYFACGEYGEDKPGHYGRPHYHAILFGHPGCLRGRGNGQCSCDSCGPINDTWKLGLTHNGEVNLKTAAYVAGYVTKKMGHDDNTKRVPAFARVSRNPGLGFNSIPEVASALMASQADVVMKDVPNSLRHGDMTMPLGAIYRRKLREALGRDPSTPKEVQIAINKPWTDMFRLHVEAQKATGVIDSWTEKVTASMAGRCDQVEARLKLRRERL